ncbi:TetR/AcrR family transcriptional regulator [Microbacterium sp. 179-B 1A2 NHS]|uniref:TetR/AcrR family transcriptional regulator n=1 Tax=Microbacterium sp. 179-B 1A2 NHS TaxID=3142383 RepID=UPI0039A3F7FD
MPRASLSPAAVVDAARDLIDAEGATALSMSAVARRVNVQPASLYVHIRDLAALRAALQTSILAEVADQTADAVAGRSRLDALRGFAQAQRDYAFAHPARWAMLQEPVEDAAAASPAASRVSSLLLAVLRGYRLPESEGVHAARFVGGAVAGYLALEGARSFAHRDDSTETSWARAVDAIDRALTSWPQEAHS